MKTNFTTTRRWFMGAIALAAGLFSFAAAANADEFTDLKARFKERLLKLSPLRDSGVVGETFDGRVAIVKGGDSEAASLVAAENADRAKLYALIAAKQGVKADVVAERNAIRNFKNAEDDHYLKTREGGWTQKKNVKIDE